MQERFINKNEEFDFIYSGCIAKDSQTNRKICIYNKPIKNKDKLLFEHMCSNICATSQMMIKKELLVKIGGFPDAKAKQDYLLILKILTQKNIKVHKINQILSVYYEHTNQRISSASLERIKAEEIAYEETKKYFVKLTNKEIKEVIKNHNKRLFNISYLMQNQILMLNYLKEVLRKELYLKGVIKLIVSKKIIINLRKVVKGKI